MKKRLGAAAALTVFSACALAQGLNTSAKSTDWEEINFEFNSSVLSDGYPSLLRMAELLKDHQDYKVAVIGNTDYVGSNGYNQKLSMARANAVKDFLVKYGAGAGQVVVSGDGETVPEVSNKSKEGRFMNRRVILKVTDGSGKVVGYGNMAQVMPGLQDLLMKQEECCNKILKRLDKLDDILAAVRDLKGENDKLKSDLAQLRRDQEALRGQVAGLPKPLSMSETTSIATSAANTAATNEGNRILEEQIKRNKKFTLLGLNVGPTFGPARRNGDFTFTGKGQFFSPFGGTGSSAVQAQAEYMYYQDRQEGQFDVGLVHRMGRVQAGLFDSTKYLSMRGYQQGGWLGQGSFLLDVLFSRGKFGIFGTKGYKNEAMLNNQQMGTLSYLQTYARMIDQVGVSGQVGVWSNSYFEGNLAYLKRRGGKDVPGGLIKYVHPVSNSFALTAELGYNETLVGRGGSGRVVVGFQLGNFLRPKDYMTGTSPVAMDVPRIRYELLTRRVGNSPPVADAGPDQINVTAGSITLNGSRSSDPEGDPLTFRWEQVSGPTVALASTTNATTTFTAAAGNGYDFRLTVTDPSGLSSTARTRVSTVSNVVVTTPLRIISFAANPQAMAPGAASTLSWQVEGADSVSIAPVVGKVDPKAGTTSVSPAQTTDYTLTATGNNQTLTSTVRVTVNAVQPVAGATIVSFMATPTNITKGEASTLTWSTQNATAVTISGGVGSVSTSGNRAVSPTVTTTYTLTARGADGKDVTAAATITVGLGNVPRITQFSSSPTAITVGQSVQLCYAIENSTSIKIDPAPGAVTAASACVAVTPTTNTVYTLTATNAAGSATANVAISVTAPVTPLTITSFTNDPPYTIKQSDPVKISWTTTGASYVVVTGPFVPGGQLPANGSIVINPSTTADYTLIAYGPNGQSVSAVLHIFVR